MERWDKMSDSESDECSTLCLARRVVCAVAVSNALLAFILRPRVGSERKVRGAGRAKYGSLSTALINYGLRHSKIFTPRFKKKWVVKVQPFGDPLLVTNRASTMLKLKRAEKDKVRQFVSFTGARCGACPCLSGP